MRKILLTAALCLMIVPVFAQCIYITGDDYDVVDEDAGIFVRLAVKATLNNDCDKPKYGVAYFVAKDSSGFAVSKKTIYKEVKPYEYYEFTDDWYIRKDDYERVSDIEFVDEKR